MLNKCIANCKEICASYLGCRGLKTICTNHCVIFWHVCYAHEHGKAC